ncbi:hypothetical protein KEF85_14245 [Methylomonas paludis]|uniref:Uncharacterized protein n=1 Tax=Methylomonas paludis TaxID=1173101 RepID=A0A975MN95_9GAMM|nr:hypothetical protein [Methylomonas paludis]QWF70481.1 hypothetical protein KEF85_14245 [Methylomonas paludis]
MLNLAAVLSVPLAAFIAAVESNADKEVVADLVSTAKQQQKDIENNDLEVKRQQAGKRLNNAWKAAREGDLQLAGTSAENLGSGT